ncbi:hypothetical protein M2145_001311 [Lachnospiraceae bacterium PF1-21]|uniref:sugar ABC transporter substrate-binding protein n=1 Tax=Ohessyouella blattaphilus TaxID=2949333 RepID=UPI003E20AF55
MKKKLMKWLSVGLVSVLLVSMLAGCGKKSDEGSETKSDGGKGETVKIGVLVADVSSENAMAFSAYYNDYVAKEYNVEFQFTDALEDAASEKAAIEKYASQGCQGIISMSSSDRALQIETCEEYEVYYAVATGMLDDAQYEEYKSNEFFVGQIGASMTAEYETGLDMAKYFVDKGAKKVAIYGAFIPNPMHVYRTAGVLAGLGCTYGGASDQEGIAGQIFGDQGVDLSKVAGDVEVVAYFQGYGDTTADEFNAASQAAPDAFISVGMGTTFFAQQLNTAEIPFGDIDSFTSSNSEAMKNGKLEYIAAVYGSSIGPVFAVMLDAINGNVIRDEEGNALSINQAYAVATNGDEFDEYFLKDNSDSPIFDKETLDAIVSDTANFEDVKSLVEAH